MATARMDLLGFVGKLLEEAEYNTVSGWGNDDRQH